MEQVMNLLFGSLTGQLTLAIMAVIFGMAAYFIYLFVIKSKPE